MSTRAWAIERDLQDRAARMRPRRALRCPAVVEVQPCPYPRQFAAATLQEAMIEGRAVRLSLRPPPHGQVVGQVVSMQRGRPGRDPFAPHDEVTFTIVTGGHIASTSAPIALGRVCSIDLL